MFNRRNILGLTFTLLMTTSSFAADKINIFAAASLKNALDAVSASWKVDTNKEATLTYAASNALAKQIEAGAPADVFVSADLTWMKYLTDKNLIAASSDVKLLGNQIVLVAGKDSKIDLKIENVPMNTIWQEMKGWEMTTLPHLYCMEKMKNDIGYVPSTSLKEGIKDAIETPSVITGPIESIPIHRRMNKLPRPSKPNWL